MKLNELMAGINSGKWYLQNETCVASGGELKTAPTAADFVCQTCLNDDEMPDDQIEREKWIARANLNARMICHAANQFPDLILFLQHMADDPYLLTPDQWAAEARGILSNAQEVE